MIFFWTIFFFFFAAPARRAILSNLRVVLPGSNPLLNQARAWLTLYNFAWTIADAADHKLAKTEFAYEVEGEEFLEQLAAARGAILLTAHMGSYDLGAAVFAQRFQREIRMVRAPEADAQTARHLDESLERAGAGAVKVAYNTSNMALPLELLNAIRAGEIVSIQGDRPVPNASQRAARLFGRIGQAAGRAIRARLGRAGADLSGLHRADLFSPLQDHRSRTDSLSPHRARPGSGDRGSDAGMDPDPGEGNHCTLVTMVFVSPDLSHAMKENGSASFQRAETKPQAGSLRYPTELGYAFALPRLIARTAGRKPRRAEFSGAEAYGLGILVFGISCVFVARALLPLVRPLALQLLVLFVLPFAIWVALLLLYYLNSLVVALLRKLGLYTAVTNTPFQHFVIMSLTTVLACILVRDETGWMRSLGIFWLGLLSLNLLSIFLEKLLDES